jgi:hypothetical protein
MDRRDFLRISGGLAALSALPSDCISLETESDMVKRLDGLDAEMTYVGDLHLGCLKGSLDYLGIPVSRPWLAGTTAQAFVIAIAEEICLSSVGSCLEEAYLDGTMMRLGENLGYHLEYHRFAGDDPKVHEKRENGWSRLRDAIDAGHPCYGYYNFCYQLFAGYDDEGFYIGPGATNAGQGPCSLQDSGDLCIVSPNPSSACSDREAAKDGLTFALAHARGGDAGQPHDPGAGLAYGVAAYDRWIAAMEAGKEGGTWRAIDHYVRCRDLAVEFLKEAEDRLSDGVAPDVRGARADYQGVSDALWPIADAFGQGKKPVPFGQPGSFHGEAADRLRDARDGEARGLAALQRIAAAL